MICYKDGDVNKGGFRYLTDETICVDYCEENHPIDLYLKNLIQYVNKNGIKKIFINGPLTKKIDVSFLYELKSIESLQISALCESLKPIYSLKLKVLKLHIQDKSVDFCNFKDSLEEVVLYNLNPLNGKKLQLNDSILKCKKLKLLSVSSFNSTDCNIIRKLKWLQDLGLANCIDKKIELDWIKDIKGLKKLELQKLTINKFKLVGLSHLKDLSITQLNVTTLDCVQDLIELEYLKISNCSKLTDISALSSCVKLRKLEFGNTKRILDYEQLSALKELQGLILANCGNISTISFIKDMTNLQFFSFVGTNVVDGDLTPCLRLQYASTMNKRHYNIRAEELPNKLKCSFQDL